jgi:hypothetical protein
MSNRFGLPDSLLDAVKDITKENKEVRQYRAFGLTTEKKMDPVGKADADIDNDGDTDASDKYLHNRRKAIKKAMGKESKVVINPEVKEEYTHDDFKKDRMAKVKSTGATGRVIARYRHDDGEIHYTLDHGGNKTSKHPASKLAVHKEETKVDSKLENPHNCATHVYSEQWGDGRTVTTMHADPDEYGIIAWYDVMFEHGIEKGVPIEELKVVKSESHMHGKRSKK